MELNTKAIAIKNIEKLCEMDESSGEYSKMDKWISGLISIPFNKFINLPINNENTIDEKRDFILNTKSVLDKSIYGHNDAKTHILQVIGKWIKNPKTTLNDERTKITAAVIEESQKLTINQVIERICKEGFPKAKKIGKLSANSIKEFTKFMIGYNWRTRHLIYTENSKGHGQVSFKANTHKRTAKPDDWSDLFNKFPTGHGIIKDKKFKHIIIK